MCAGVTAFNAVSEAAKGQPGGSVLNVIGAGGVGRLMEGAQVKRYGCLSSLRLSCHTVCQSNGLPGPRL